MVRTQNIIVQEKIVLYRYCCRMYSYQGKRNVVCLLAGRTEIFYYFGLYSFFRSNNVIRPHPHVLYTPGTTGINPSVVYGRPTLTNKQFYILYQVPGIYCQVGMGAR